MVEYQAGDEVTPELAAQWAAEDEAVSKFFTPIP